MPSETSHTEIINSLRQQLLEKDEENKKINEDLDKFQHALEGSNDGIWDWDLINNLPFVNTPWKTMLGFGPDEEVNIHGLWQSLLHPEDKVIAIKGFDDFIASKASKYDNVFRLKHKNGSYRWIRSRALVKFNKENIAYRVSGTHTDITDQKKALRALEESEKKYRALFQNSLIAIFRSEIISGKIVDYNSKLVELLCIKNKDQLVTHDFYYNPTDREWVVEELKDKGVINQKELQLKRADGELIWVSFSSAIYPAENIIECVLIDITESVLVKKREKSNEEKYRMLFENSLMGIVREDISTGEIIDANEKFWEILKEKNRKSKKTVDYYLDPNDRQMLRDAKVGNRIENVELQLKRADGEIIWILIGALLNLKDNMAESIVVDITQSKLDNIELQKVNFELDSFVYHSSHDLRSPLRSILGLINIYRHETDSYLKDEYIDRIEQSINKLDHLVQELLSISRNDRINDPFVDINFMIEADHSVDGYYTALDTDNLSLETKIKQPVKFVSDLTRVKILLNNIVSNAIKYRDTSKELSKVVIDIEVDPEKAKIQIIDNGEGIPSDQIPYIFDMFHRASDHSEGSGLGLYIVKNVVDKLNAQISVSSELGIETVFTIIIPNVLADK